MADLPPLLGHIPHGILREMALYLDTQHNWRAMGQLVPEYTRTEILAFTIEEQRGGSPGMAMMMDLHSRGWTAADFAALAARARLTAVTDVLHQHYPHCQRQLHTGLPHSASTCYDRPSNPPSPPPPTVCDHTPPTMKHHTSPAFPVEVPYAVLYKGTNHFSKCPYKEGGFKLGEGGFGEVFWCKVKVDNRDTETAVKVLNKLGENSSVSKQQFITEQESLMLPPHECLLPIIGYSTDGPFLCLLYPYMPRGSLDKHLTDFEELTPVLRVGVAHDIARALQVLHTGIDRVVVHRDVKSANILITKSWRAKLGDFGVVRFLPSTETIHTSTIVGTLVYMAPEYAKGIVSPAADIYGFGVVLYELLLGQSAQEEINGTDLLSFVEDTDESELPEIMSRWPEAIWREMWSMAGTCIEHNRRKRPSSEMLVQNLDSLQKSLDTQNCQ